jgi:hypothetical protein
MGTEIVEVFLLRAEVLKAFRSFFLHLLVEPYGTNTCFIFAANAGSIL